MRLLAGRLERKVQLIISVVVVIPMLAAGWLAAEWVAKNFERRLELWIVDSARAGERWLEAYQNDSVMLGKVFADEPGYLPARVTGSDAPLPESVRRITHELGLNLVQVYDAERRLVYTSLPVKLQAEWERGQTGAVLKVARNDKTALAAVGITPVPRHGRPHYYLVLGSLIGQDFISELTRLTGLKTRLYYRDGRSYYDVFTHPGRPVPLDHLSRAALRRLEVQHQPVYSVQAEHGAYRGVYTPIVDSTGRVEAVLFAGLERRTYNDVLTNRAALFFGIALLGVLIGGLTGVFLSRLVLKPVEYLRNGVLALAGQDFNANVPIESNDELGDLAKAFNAMAARLRAARQEREQSFQRDKLAAMGELSAALAHEIRNPIGVISAAAGMLDKPGLDATKRAELTRMLREETARIGTLLQDFLQLSRHRTPAFDVIDPVLPLERALAAALAGSAAVKVEKHFDHGDARVLADVGLLQQAWSNLLTNALQAMERVPAPRLTLASRRDGGEVILSVEDNGAGIPPDIMPRLFEPFFTTKTHGTGLGLPIAYTLVEANGGRLEAQAPAAGGARFVMRFPVHQERV